MTTTSCSSARPVRQIHLPLPRTLSAYLSLWRQRRALERLDSAMLQDIGLTRTEAQTEALRPFWDAPDHWHR